MTPSNVSLRNLLDDVRRTLRRDTTLAVVLAALCAVPGALLAAWLVGLVAPWSRPGPGPLLLDLFALGAGAALAYYGIRRWLDSLDEGAVAADAERTAGMPQGAVRGAVELSRSVPEGTSTALARRAEMEIGRRFTDIAPGNVAATLRARTRSRRRTASIALASLSVLTVLVAFATPDHSRAAWSPMVRPMRNLVTPPLPPLGVQPGNTEVQRGTDLPVHIVAPGREAVTLHWRMRGDVPREEIGPVMGDSAVISIPVVSAPTEYWVVAPDGAISATYNVVPTDPLLLSELSIDIVYPQHVGRAADHFRGDVPPIEVPEGTQLVIRGRATRSLTRAALAADAGRTVAFTVADDGFRGAFTPTSSGTFVWQLTDATGGELATAPAPLEITVLEDGPPQVEITYPSMDTILDASMRQAIVADARDDYGLADATLISWRVSRTGERGIDVEQPIPLNGDDRELMRGLLDASARDLVPGDTLKFLIRVTDNSPRRQQSVSRTIALRLPGMTELREQTNERTEELFRQTEELRQKSEEISQATRDIERRTSAANARRSTENQRGSNGGGQSSTKRMDFEEAAAARQLLERQEKLVENVEAMREQLEALERAMERAGLRDAELQERLAELRKLQEEMLTPEMREKMDELRAALEQLDPEALERALEEMAKHQDQLKEQLEKSVDLMRKAAAEQEMNSLAQEARELATQQQALAESMAQQPPTAEQAKQQEELAKRAEELAASLEQMQQKLEQQGESQTAEKTGEAQQTTEQAGEQMDQAARDAAKQNGSDAAEKGERAAEQLEKAAESLDQARQAMADSWKQDAQQSMQQATQDALKLAQQQQQLLDRMKQAEEQQGSQGQQAQQMPKPGQQSQQQQTGEQRGKQTGQQQNGQQSGQQGQTGKEGKQGQEPGQQRQGGTTPGEHAGGGSSGETKSMESEQAALQQSLQQLGRNLQENAEQNASVNRESSAALARANLSMQETLEQLKQGQIPTDQAQQTVDALNRLALSLLNNSESMNQGESGEGSQSMQQMAEIAKKQGNLNGRSNALSPMNITPSAMRSQLEKLATEQMEIARELGDMNRGGRDDLLGDIDALAREAEDLARQMQIGQLPPEALARQERLFHRMLDAGRTLEKNEVEDERTAERPGRFEPRNADELDAALFRDPTRFRAPSADELRDLPPAYRRLILDYFERLNRPATQAER